jgi:hypothetical protein
MAHPKTWEFGYNNFTDTELNELRSASIDEKHDKPLGLDISDWSISDDDLVRKIKQLNSEQQPAYWWIRQYITRMCEAGCARKAAEYRQAEGNAEGNQNQNPTLNLAEMALGVLVVFLGYNLIGWLFNL